MVPPRSREAHLEGGTQDHGFPPNKYPIDIHDCEYYSFYDHFKKNARGFFGRIAP
jgi:hypothetical protein